MLLGCFLTKAYIDLEFLVFDEYLDWVDSSVISQGTDRSLPLFVNQFTSIWGI